MSTLWIEPVGGVAGDMLLGALLDLPEAAFGARDLEELVQRLLPGECQVEVRPDHRRGFRGLRVAVEVRERVHHRRLDDVLELVDSAPIGPRARRIAAGAFRRLAAAEARAHGIPPERVHFHEVGAADAVVDVCGVAEAVARLAPEAVACSPVWAGSGTVTCAHGEIPVPAPGAAELLLGLPVVLGGAPGERATPTGAALLRELVDSQEPPRPAVPRAIGYGLGARDPAEGPPNLLRVQVLEATRETGQGRVWQLEVNLDDARGEAVGFLVEELRAAGALEVWTVPAQMKKDRPGAVVVALARADRRAELERLAFEHSPTLGVRWIRCERTELGRREVAVEVGGHRVRVKVRLRPGHERPARVDLAPEHDDVAACARALDRPLEDVRHEAVELALARV